MDVDYEMLINKRMMRYELLDFSFEQNEVWIPFVDCWQVEKVKRKKGAK